MSYTYQQTAYPPGDYYDYSNEQLYCYDNSNSPSSSGGGSHAMTATNSSQSMSSTSSITASPFTWEWDEQQQCYVQIYTTMLSFSQPEHQAYIQPGVYLQQQAQSPPEDPTFIHQPQYIPEQQAPTQDLPWSQGSGRSARPSPPKQYICLEPGCESRGHFTRAADLTRHQNTVHDIKKRYPCPRPNCPRKGERGFSRNDHLIEHLRTTHGRDIPRRRERARS